MFDTPGIERRIRERAKTENDTQILNLSDKELHSFVMCILRDYLIEQEEREKKDDR